MTVKNNNFLQLKIISVNKENPDICPNGNNGHVTCSTECKRGVYRVAITDDCDKQC